MWSQAAPRVLEGFAARAEEKPGSYRGHIPLRSPFCRVLPPPPACTSSSGPASCLLHRWRCPHRLHSVLARRMKPTHSVVNCWFCSQDTVVPYGNRNCWDCPHCEQYNGFQEVRPPPRLSRPRAWPCAPPLRMRKQAQGARVTCARSQRSTRLVWVQTQIFLAPKPIFFLALDQAGQALGPDCARPHGS